MQAENDKNIERFQWRRLPRTPVIRKAGQPEIDKTLDEDRIYGVTILSARQVTYPMSPTIRRKPNWHIWM
jgi:hypothetical protein